MNKKRMRARIYGLNFNSNLLSRNNPFIFTLVFVFLFCLSSVSFAQDVKEEEFPPGAEPPPFKVLTEKEKDQLEGETKLKKRTKLALVLMDARLNKAEDAKSKNKYDEVFTELGRFHAIIDHTLRYLNRKNNDSRGVLNNFKRLEIGLRKFLPRIELIRRDVPLKYQYYVKSLIKNVRRARSRAIEPFYDNSVISDDKGS